MYALLMVKNEEDVVLKTLKSVVSHVEKLFVYDTGSTDNTIEICRKFAPHIEVKEGVWVNFSVSRNEALEWAESQVPPNSWILMLDAADELRMPEKKINLGEVKDDINGFFIRQVWKNPGKWHLESNELKLIRSGCGWKWKHPVHEMLVKKEKKKCNLLSNIIIYQDRSTELKKSAARHPWDLAILKAEHLEHPECPRTMFYLAQTLSNLGRKKEALEMYMKRCRSTASEREDSWEKYRAMIRCGSLYAFFSKVDESIDWYLRAASESERLGYFIPEGIIQVGRICRQIGRLKLAYMYLNYAAQFEVDDTFPDHVDKKLINFTRWNELAVTAWKIGKFEEGKKAAIKAGTDLTWFDTHPLFKKSYYINLEKRIDRRKHVEKELKKILVNNPVRIDAIPHQMGIVGCLQSHIKTLETFLSSSNEKFVSIFEDDVVFKNPEIVVKGVRDLAEDEDWDVLMLGGMNDGPVEKYKNFSAMRVTKCMSCVAYIVRRTYVPTLLTFWKKLLKRAEAAAAAAIVSKYVTCVNLDDIALDRAWFELQQKHMYVLIMPLTVSQFANYSDSWGMNINWEPNMLNLHKKNFRHPLHGPL